MDDILYLFPDGYPVTIDVAQASIAGAGTAMHFVLPPKAHNLPLMHVHETKLLAALDGEVEIRSGGRTIALLRQGEAVLLHPGVAHRVHQHGAHPAKVGVALWPGRVEQAFREMAAEVAKGPYRHDAMIALLARYDVAWNAPAGEEPVHAEVRPLQAWLPELPPQLASALQQTWRAYSTPPYMPIR
jgi:quercetin dioxygenase-like cupin family protein